MEQGEAKVLGGTSKGKFWLLFLLRSKQKRAEGCNGTARPPKACSRTRHRRSEATKVSPTQENRDHQPSSLTSLSALPYYPHRSGTHLASGPRFTREAGNADWGAKTTLAASRPLYTAGLGSAVPVQFVKTKNNDLKKAKWLREKERPLREEAARQKAEANRQRRARLRAEKTRKKEFLDPDSHEWMQHIDLKDIGEGRDAYEKEGLRDDALKKGSTYIDNMAGARAYTETALESGPLDFRMYDELHRRAMKGAATKDLDKLHPDPGSYGYRAGKGGRSDDETLAKIMKGPDNPTPLLHGMRAAQQLGPLYDYGAVFNHAHTSMNENERLDYIKDRRSANSDEFRKGVMVEFPPRQQNEIKKDLEGWFQEYHGEVKLAKEKAPAEREDGIRRATSSLHQKLERSHAYADGNGRTNLALLNALLKHEKLYPVILDDPGSSHVVTAEHWDEQVQKGQQRWSTVNAAAQEPGDRASNISDALLDFDKTHATEDEFKYKKKISQS